HAIPYATTISLAHPEDTLRKLRHALDTTGFRFLHILSPCPTGWKSEPAEGIDLIRLAVSSGLYPVYEVFDGERMSISVEPEMSVDALERYFSLQGRFRRGSVDIDRIGADIGRNWARLRMLAEASPAGP
ncbi:MAG: pyruvate synthase subunit beta, partial [Planctomycetota bacterium]